MFKEEFSTRLESALESSERQEAQQARKSLDALKEAAERLGSPAATFAERRQQELAAGELYKASASLQKDLFLLSLKSMEQDIETIANPPKGAADNVHVLPGAVQAYRRMGRIKEVISPETHQWEGLMQGLASEMGRLSQEYGLPPQRDTQSR